MCEVLSGVRHQLRHQSSRNKIIIFYFKSNTVSSICWAEIGMEYEKVPKVRITTFGT